MNYYSLYLSDHAKSSWALHKVIRMLPNRRHGSELPPVFYKFFPGADIEVRMKPQYLPFCCQKCGRYESYDMFDVGFDDPVTVRLKGDYGHTHDRIFVINNKFLRVLERAKVGGYITKPLGSSGWHALRVVLLVDNVDGVIKIRKPFCRECGRPREAYGLFKYLRELSLPIIANTFFTTKKSWPCHFSDRDIFITEDVLNALKEGEINGGCCTRLLTDEEMKKQKEKEKQGIKFWRPPSTTVFLNGKRERK